MPAAGPQNTRKAQIRRKKVKAPAPKPSSQNAAYYVSQGKAVQKVATQQKRAKRIRRRIRSIEGDPPRTAQERAATQPATDRAVLQSRIKYLRRTRKPVTTLKAELEGKGLLAKGLSKIAKNSAYTSSGADSTGALGVGRRLTGGGGAPKGSAAILASGKSVPLKDAKLLGRAAQDLVNFPAQAIPSLYVPAAAAVEAAQGHPRRLRQFKKDIAKSDPVYNAGAALVAKAKGDDKAAAAHLRNAGKAASEHPGFTALEVAGVKGTIGRGIGRVVKAPERASANVEGTGLAEKRTYSPDAIRRQRQKATDKVQTKRAQRLRVKAQTAKPADAQALQRKANRVDPTKMTASQVRRRVDERVAANEDVRRINRAQVTHAVDTQVGKKGGAALSLVAQNITKASKDDLRAYRDEIATHFDNLDRAGRRANKELRRRIDKVLKDPKVNLEEVQAAAQRYEKITAPIQAKLTERNLLANGQADKAKLIPYAVRRMGATHDPEQGIVSTRAVKRAGKPATEETVALRPQVIRAHMRRNDTAEPAFLTQAPNQRGARNYYTASDRAPVIRNARRTGEATRQGTFDAHPETLRENAAKAQGLADATDGFTGFVKEVGHRDDTGAVRTFKNKDEAQKAADNLQATEGGDPTGGMKFRPIRLNPWGAKDAQLHRLLDEVNSDSPTAAKAVADAITSAIDKNATGDGPWALIPEPAADQLVQHMKVLGPGGTGKVGQLINSSFRKTVLSTSPKWLLGNVTEAAGRAAVAKAGPRSYLTGKHVLRRLDQLDPQAAKEASVRTVGGGHFAMAERQPRRDHTQFEDTHFEGLAKNLGAFWQAPGPRQAAGLWHGWTDFVFNRVNRPVESKFQTAMLGKAIRDSHLMDGQTLKLSKTAIDQAARGLKNTSEQVAFGRAVDRMYGKYNKFSPGARRAIALYTPFVAWTLNAYRFVSDVLPRDHPTVTALTVATEQATDEWRKQHGLDLFIDAAVPGFIQGSVPGKGGKHWPVSRYLPFGAFGAPTETLGGAVLPQLSGVLAALQRGEDWKGSKLKMGGKPIGGDPLKRSAYAAQVFAEATIPALGLAKRLIQQGPGTLNPAKPIQPKKAKIRSSTPKSGVRWSDQGSGVKWSDQSSGVKWGG